MITSNLDTINSSSTIIYNDKLKSLQPELSKNINISRLKFTENISSDADATISLHEASELDFFRKGYSSIRMGNFLDNNSAITPNTMKSKSTISSNSFPALLMYDVNATGQVYPLLDIGIKKFNGVAQSYIAFKKSEQGSPDYGYIKLDPQGNIFFGSENDTIIGNSKTKVEIGNSRFLKSNDLKEDVFKIIHGVSDSVINYSVGILFGFLNLPTENETVESIPQLSLQKSLAQDTQTLLTLDHKCISSTASTYQISSNNANVTIGGNQSRAVNNNFQLIDMFTLGNVVGQVGAAIVKFGIGLILNENSESVQDLMSSGRDKFAIGVNNSHAMIISNPSGNNSTKEIKFSTEFIPDNVTPSHKAMFVKNTNGGVFGDLYHLVTQVISISKGIIQVKNGKVNLIKSKGTKSVKIVSKNPLTITIETQDMIDSHGPQIHVLSSSDKMNYHVNLISEVSNETNTYTFEVIRNNTPLNLEEETLLISYKIK